MLHTRVLFTLIPRESFHSFSHISHYLLFLHFTIRLQLPWTWNWPMANGTFDTTSTTAAKTMFSVELSISVSCVLLSVEWRSIQFQQFSVPRADSWDSLQINRIEWAASAAAAALYAWNIHDFTWGICFDIILCTLFHFSSSPSRKRRTQWNAHEYWTWVRCFVHVFSSFFSLSHWAWRIFQLDFFLFCQLRLLSDSFLLKSKWCMVYYAARDRRF